MHRRDVLRALGVMGMIGVGIDPIDVIRRNVERDLGVTSSDRDIHDWEIVASCYGQDLGAVAPPVLLGQLMTDLTEAGAVLHSGLPGAARARMLRVVAHLSAAAAVTVVALGRPRDALRWWRTARRSAEQAGDADLETFVLGQQALLSLYGGHTAQTSLDLAERGLTVGAGRVCTGGASARAAHCQALARLGRRAEALASLQGLLRLFDQLPDDVTRASTWYAYPEHTLRHTESYVHTWLGSHARAAEAQERVLALYPSDKYRGRAQINLHQATCLILQGDVPAGTTHAITTLEALPPAAREDRFVHEIASATLASIPATPRHHELTHRYRGLLDLASRPSA